MNKSLTNLIVVLVVVLIFAVIFILLGPFYILNEGEQAVVRRFEKVVASATEAGLKFKMPIIDQVEIYSKKILTWNGLEKEMKTLGGDFMIVNTTARWRISDPIKFAETFFILEKAYQGLDDKLEAAMQEVVRQNEIYSVVRDSNRINEALVVAVVVEDPENPSTLTEFEKQLAEVESTNIQPTIQEGRRALTKKALEMVVEDIKRDDWGIEIIDFVIRQVNYSDKKDAEGKSLRDAVFERMESERKKVASFYRSYGEGRRQQLLGELENEKRRIISEAYEEAEIIRGSADAEAARIYSASYSQDPSFFKFWRAIESYRKTLPSFNKTMATDLEYFDYLYNTSGN
jgi:membrane protease subunit HflC